MKQTQTLLKRIFTIAIAFIIGAAYAPAMGDFVWAEESDAARNVELPSITAGQTEIEDWDSNQLLSEYIDRQLVESEGLMPMTLHPNTGSLTAEQKGIYNILLEGIKTIASGERSDAVITVKLVDAGFQPKQYTAAELGVASIYSRPGVLTEDAKTAIMSKINSRGIIQALSLDYPYELYWYDKTIGVVISPNISATSATIGFSEDSSITFSFTVAKEYQAAGATDKYQVDTGQTGATSTAVDNIKKVVSDNANKSDYDKLVAYKQYICDEVSYNSEAADDKNKVAYGNPWQLIWVFDNDPDTNVVCEGYSKAFKYLCDLSEFNKDIICNIAIGTINSGGHMWNLVQMNNGLNYMVDVTNCDDGTVGYPDKLFLVSPSSGELTRGYKFVSGSTYTYDGLMFDAYNKSILALTVGAGAYDKANDVDVSTTTQPTTKPTTTQPTTTKPTTTKPATTTAARADSTISPSTKPVTATKAATKVAKPAKTSIRSLNGGKKSFTVRWYKKARNVTGYQIQYSTSSKFSKNKKTIKVKSYRTTSKKIKKLKSKKRYYVRVRTYRTVNGKTYYSKWSTKKRVKTK